MPRGVFCPIPSTSPVTSEYKPKVPEAFSVKFESEVKKQNGAEEITSYEDHYDFNSKVWNSLTLIVVESSSIFFYQTYNFVADAIEFLLSLYSLTWFHANQWNLL